MKVVIFFPFDSRNLSSMSCNSYFHWTLIKATWSTLSF